MKLDRNAARQLADAFDQASEPLGRPGTCHAGQHRVGDVLQRQVEVRSDLVDGSHRLEQLRAQLGRLQVHQSQPVDPVDLGQLPQQGRLQVASTGVPVEAGQVLAPRGGVLGHQHQLAHPLRRQPGGLGHDLVDGARTEAAPEGRDGTEGAQPVAAGCDLEVGPRRAGRRQLADREPRAGGRHAVEVVLGGQVHRRLGVRTGRAGLGHGSDPRGAGHCAGLRGRRGLGGAGQADQREVPSRRGGRGGRVDADEAVVGPAGHDVADQAGQGRVPGEAHHGVGLGDRVGEVGRVALCHAPDHHHAPGSRLLQVTGGQHRVDGFLLGRGDERARVDQDDVGVVGVGDHLHPVACEESGQLVRIDLIAAAPQRDDRDTWGGRLRGGGRHRGTREQLEGEDGPARSAAGDGTARARGWGALRPRRDRRGRR